MERGRLGKPIVRHPPGLNVSQSHSSGWTAAAVSIGFPVGIDIELIRPVRSADRILEHLRGSTDIVKQGPENGRCEFLAEWTAREAITKAIGVGMRAMARLQFAGRSTGEFCRYRDPLDEREWWVRHLTLSSNRFVCAVAYPRAFEVRIVS